MTKPKKRDNTGASKSTQGWELSVFVMPDDPTSIRALENLERICSEYLDADHRIEVVNIEEDPGAADCFEIIVTPTVIRRHPEPERRIIGDLSATARALAGLGISHLTSPAYDG